MAVNHYRRNTDQYVNEAHLIVWPDFRLTNTLTKREYFLLYLKMNAKKVKPPTNEYKLTSSCWEARRTGQLWFFLQPKFIANLKCSSSHIWAAKYCYNDAANFYNTICIIDMTGHRLPNRGHVPLNEQWTTNPVEHMSHEICTNVWLWSKHSNYDQICRQLDLKSHTTPTSHATEKATAPPLYEKSLCPYRLQWCRVFE